MEATQAVPVILHFVTILASALSRPVQERFKSSRVLLRQLRALDSCIIDIIATCIKRLQSENWDLQGIKDSMLSRFFDIWIPGKVELSEHIVTVQTH